MYSSIFHLISDLVHKENIKCVLIGGFAVNFYHVTRQTADVDFLITKEDFDKIADELLNAGYKRKLLENNFAQYAGNKLSLMDVDFMFVDNNVITTIINDGQKLKIVGKVFIVPSLHHLIALKLHSIKYNPKIRLLKDFPDIINLIRINKINVKDKKFEDLCLKYGSEELYRKISEAAL